MMDHRLFSLGGFKATSSLSLSLSSLEISLCMYLTFSGKFINYVTFQSKTMSKLGSNSSAWRTIINFYSDKKVQKRMELLLSYRILWPSSTAYCRKCSVANALSVMKNNMGKFKKGFQLRRILLRKLWHFDICATPLAWSWTGEFLHDYSLLSCWP